MVRSNIRNSREKPIFSVDDEEHKESKLRQVMVVVFNPVEYFPMYIQILLHYITLFYV